MNTINVKSGNRKRRRWTKTLINAPELSINGYAGSVDQLRSKKNQTQKNLKEAKKLISQELKTRYD